MRALVLIVLGLVVGALGTVMALNALRQGTPFHQGLMSVMAHHNASLRRMGDPQDCVAERIPGHLQMLRLAGDDLETAFLPTMNDARFIEYAQAYRAVLDEALQAPALDCAGAASMAARIGDSCSACHRDFR